MRMRGSRAPFVEWKRRNGVGSEVSRQICRSSFSAVPAFRSPPLLSSHIVGRALRMAREPGQAEKKCEGGFDCLPGGCIFSSDQARARLMAGQDESRTPKVVPSHLGSAGFLFGPAAVVIAVHLAQLRSGVAWKFKLFCKVLSQMYRS